MASFVTSNTSGISTTTTYTAATSSADTWTAPGIALGTTVFGTDNAEYLWVIAGSAITQYSWVGVDENMVAYPLTKAMADDGWQIGVSQLAFAIGSYGVVALKGANLTGRVGASCAADVALYTSATAGVLDDTASSQTKIDGVVLVTANASATVRAKEVLLTWPRSSTF